MASNANSWSMGKILGVSAAAGVVVFLFLMWLLQYSGWSAFLWGLIIGVVVFLILWLNFGSADDAGHGAGAGAGAAGAGAGASAASAAAEAPAAAPEAAAPAEAAEAAESAADAAATQVAEPEAEAEEPAAEAADDAAAAGTAAAPETTGTAASAVKPSKSLPGEADLDSRKGEWKYQGGDSAGGAAKAPAVDLGEDYDKDGVREGTDEGTKPAMLSAAREGGPDNLKEIKGVGPKLEQLLHSLGVYHFDQIGAWTADEVAWVDANLKGFRGRVSRDGWVEQAKILAAGGETEFSKRVDKGGVY